MDDSNDLFGNIDKPAAAPRAAPRPLDPIIQSMAKRSAQQKDGSEGYDASHIEVLEGLEPVRRRPGMYIGGTDEKALHHLFAEVIDNSMDEAVAGHATFIEVESRPTAISTVTDNGRGIPVDPHPEVSRQVGARSHHDARCMPAASSTPRSTRPPAACMASACRSSTRCRTMLEVEVARGRQLYRQRFSRGMPQGPTRGAGRRAQPARHARSASIRIRRSSARARRSSRRGFAAWRARRPICSAASRSAGPARPN